MLFPEIPMGVIDRSNASIDNPSRAQRYMYRSVLNSNTLPDILGVGLKGHRRFNHDPVGGYLACFQVAGNKYAMQAWLGHIVADKMSNNMRNNMGSARRDLIEALLHVQHTDSSKRKRKIRF